jgi:hypothetical protein
MGNATTSNMMKNVRPRNHLCPEMNIYTKNLIFLLFLQLIGIYLFKEGFLLVRLELSNRTTEVWPDQIVKDEPDAFKTGLKHYSSYH